MSKKTYTRDTETALVGGVVAGLADYMDQDPVLFRLIAIGLLIVTGIFPGLLFYVFAWLFVPRKRVGTAKVDYDL